MAKINAILACDEAGGIAKDGSLPWPKNSKDLKWFKEHTTNGVVVMGSNTWNDSFMPAPLPNRLNVVVTSKSESCPGANLYITKDIVESIQMLREAYFDKSIWIIGGANIISQTLNLIDTFYISRIPGVYDCDRFLPLKKINTLFELVEEDKHPEVSFQTWKKRNA